MRQQMGVKSSEKFEKAYHECVEVKQAFDDFVRAELYDAVEDAHISKLYMA